MRNTYRAQQNTKRADKSKLNNIQNDRRAGSTAEGMKQEKEGCVLSARDLQILPAEIHLMMSNVWTSS